MTEHEGAGPASELREAADFLAAASHSAGHVLRPENAARLSEWLRGEAWQLDQVARDFVDPSDPEAVKHMELVGHHALVFARTLMGNGDTDSD